MDVWSKWIRRNFGFVRSKDTDGDVYFRLDEQTSAIHAGSLVLFSVQSVNGRLSAVDLTVVGGRRPEELEVTGLVMSWNTEKGFGFIDAEGDKIFCHQDDVGILECGSRVTCTVVNTFKGKKATKVTNVEQPEQLAGIVTGWNTEKGYGFIAPDKGEGLVFCHEDDVGILKKGSRVTFRVVNTLKGKKATSVSIAPYMRTPCRNPACKGGHFTDNCPLKEVATKASKSEDDAASEETCSTAATMPCPSRRVLPSPSALSIPGPAERFRARRGR